ncbi:MAG: hemagglutinin repeat-containing protein [Ramlibacter sp.]
MNLSTQASLQTQAQRLTALDHALQQQMQQPLPAAPSGRVWLKRVARAFIGVYLVQTLAATGPVWAQVTAAPGAVAGQKPLIDAAANGVPIVHIAPPSAAGVSRNQYQQFNVPGNGLILNNSNTSVQTQQGGWITGNLQLGLTPARIILNEVVGPDASQLRGTIEVAGQRADIVIANPNGISCDGCGFLNTAGRITLAAGQVRLGAGGVIEGFDASGHLSVGAAGLNAAEQEQLDLIARGLVIEGEVWARNLNVIAGANQVLYGTLQAVAGGASTAGAPLFAVDIKQLGGMYANQIYMVATDKGLGVNSTGRIAALQGNLVLSANGDLTLKDSYAARDLGLKSAGTVTLNGQTLADATARIEAPTQLVNRGPLQAPVLQLDTPRLDNSGSIAQTAPGQNLTLTLPGGLQNTGQIYTPGDLAIQAGAVSGSGSTAGQLVAGGSLQLSATQLQLAGQQLAANGNIAVQAQTLSATNGSMNAGGNISLDATGQLDVTGTTVQANGQTRLSGAGIALDRARIGAVGDVQITSAGAVTADASDIGSNASLTVQGSRVDLRSATMTAVVTASVNSTGEIRLDGSQFIAGQRVALQGQGIHTAGATVAAGKIAIDAGSGALNNQGGRVQASATAADALSVQATGINNQGGELHANGGLTLDARGGLLDNTNGLVAGTSGTLNNLGGLTNKGGVLYTQSDLNIVSTALDNSQGAIVTTGSLTVTTPGQTINNTAGLLQAGGSVSLDSGSADLRNAGGHVVAGTGLTVNAGMVDTRAGGLVAGGAMSVTANTLQAAGATLGSAGAMNLTTTGEANLGTANVGAGGQLVIAAGAVQATGADLASNGNLQVTGSSITGGHWSTQGNLTATSQGALNVTSGALLAGGNVSAQGQGIVTDNAQVSGQTVTLNAGTGALSNGGGQISATATSGAALNVTATGINNAGGTLASAADASLNAGGLAINNTGGRILVTGDLQMQASQLLNRNGTLSTASSLNIQGVALDNNGGTLQTQGHLTINTAGLALDNTAGRLVAGGDATLQAGALGNAGGTISAGGAANLQATTLDTTGGRLSGARALDVLVTQRLSAGGATLSTEGRLSAAAADIDAQGATVLAGETLGLNASGVLDIRQATLKAQGPQAGDIQITGGSMLAAGATVAAGAGAALNSGGAIDMGGANLSALQGLTVQAGAALAADAATLTANQRLAISGSTVAATGASLSAGGRADVTASAGMATLNNASLQAGDTASVVATGIAASGATVGAVSQVTLNAGAGDLTAPNALVQSQNGGISLNAANINLAGSTPAGTTPTTGLLAGQAVAITATGAVDLSRALTHAGTNVSITTQGAITNNAGRIIAGGQASLTGASLDNQGGTLDANGAINLSASAGQVVNDQGRIRTRDVLTMGAPAGPLSSLSNAGGVIETTGALNAQLQNFNNQGGRVVALAGLALSGGAVNNANGLLASDGNVSVNTQGGAFTGDNSKLLSTQGSLALTAGAATLSNAQLLAAQNISLTAGTTTLTASTLTSGGNTTLATGDLQASQVQINTQGQFNATTNGTVTADRASIASGGQASITATQGVDLRQASVSAQTLQLSAGNGVLNNAAGSLVASATTGTAVTLQGQGLVNDGGTIASNADLRLNAGAGTLSNAAGRILAVGAADIRSTGLDNRAGTLAANGNLIVNAAQANANAATDSTGGTLQSGQSLTLTAGNTTLSNATLTSGGNTTLTTSDLQASQARINVLGNFSATSSGAVTADQVALAAGGNAAITAAQGIDVNHGNVSAQTINLNAGSGVLNNSAGSLIATASTGTALSLQSQGLNNDAGTIASGSGLSINASAGNVTNTSGSIQAMGAADLRSTGLNNRGGTIAANGDLTVNTVQANANAATDSTGGTLQSGQSLTLTAGATTLSNATVTSGGNTTLTTADLQASQARINVLGNLSATSGGAVTADQVVVAVGGNAAIAAAQGIDIHNGRVSAQNISLNAGSGQLNNNAGSVLAVGAADIRSTGLDNRAGTLAANGNLTVNAAQANANAATDSTGGTLQSGQAITLTAGNTTLSNATLTSGGNTTLTTSDLQASQARINVLGNFSATSSGAVTADQVALAAGGNAAITAAQGIDVNHGNVSAQTINLNAGSGVLNNSAGSLIATASTGTALSLQSQGLNNDAGTIASGSGLSINASAGNVTNTSGSIQAMGAADLRSTGLNNRGGTIAANGDLTVNTVQANANAATDSTGGTLQSGQSLTLTAGATTLSNATVTSGGNTTLTTADLQASQARINVLGNLSVTSAGAVTAGQASIAAGGNATIAATQGLDLNHASVDGQTLNLGAGSGLLNNAAGRLVASASTGTALTLQGQGLNNDGGTIASGADLSANAGAAALSNAAGSLVAVGAATVRATGLNNVDGTIAANGALVVNAAQANAATRTDNTRGTIRSAQSSLTLTTGELLNSRVNSTDAGSVINAATDLTLTANGPVDNSRSEILAGNDLRINATGVLLNGQARLVAGRDLAVNASGVDNTAGLVAGNRNTTLVVGAGGLTNTNGTVQASNNLAITSTGSVGNNGGQLLAGGQLDLAAGALTNSQGLISAQTGNATLAVTSYTNAAGSVLAGGALDLNTQGGALTANGSTFASGAGMTLRAGAAQLNDANLTAGGALDAQATSLDANRANVQAAGALTVNAGTGAFNATGSQWLANQSVALSGGAVGLTDAMVSANTSVAIAGASIDATRASFTSPGDVSVVASNGALNISNASLLAGRDLVATGTGAGTTTGAQALAGRDLTLGNGANFDFGAAGLQYQFGRDLTVHAQGISTAGQQVAARNLTLDAGNGLLNNQGGTLQATGTLSASGNGLNNQGGVIAANGTVTAAAGTGTLNNASGQIYSTQGSASVSGAVIDNATGTVSAALDVSLSGGSLNNAGNTIAAGRNLTASLSGAVNNTGGKLIANTGAASVTANGINNQSGTISGATGATAHAGSGTLTNTGGLVTGQNVTIGGAVLNSGGVISGSNSVAMTTLALNNDAGVIESGTGGISINTQGNSLTNTNSGSTRGIVSQGAINIAAGDINNQAGYIGANGGLNITQSTSINNQGGTLLGLGSSSVTTSGTLNNQGGSILSGADLTVNAGTLNNSNAGTVYAARDLSVNATAIDNSNTKNGVYTTGLLAGRNATITAGTINNTNGAIVGLGDTTVRATSSLNNAQGQIAGNVLTIDTPSMTNTGGRADAQQRLSLLVPQFSADGVLASNGALQLQLQGNYTNSGTVSANGDLSITTTGSYTNQGHVSAQNNLSLSASGIDNQAGAVIDSRVTTLTTSGTVNNAGLINSTAGQTSITAGTLNNTGRIYGDSIAISGTTNNSIGAGGSAVIASRSGDVTVNGTLNNTNGALVMSLGNLQINGSALNQGSTLNALRNLTITGALTNSNAGFSTATQSRTEPADGLYITPSGDTTKYKATDLVWVDHSGGHYVLPSTTYPLGTFGGNPRPAAVQCGFDGVGGEGGSYVCNYAYTTTDPIWALMQVTAPGTPPTSPGGDCMVFTGGEDGSFVRDTTGACGAYWTSVDAYNTATAASYTQLGTAITAFNADLNTRTLIDWYETTVTGQTITETKVTASNPGTVLAGGNISIGGGTNTDSVIVAGGNLNGGALQNLASKGTRETATTGTMVFNHRVYHGGFSDSYSRDISAPQPIPDAAVTTSFDLPILQFESSGSPNAPIAGGTSTPVGGATAVVPGSIGAGTSGARNANTAGGTTGAIQGGNATAGAGGAVQVDATAAGQPQGTTQVTGAQVTGGGAVTAGGGNAPAGGTAAVTPGTGNTPAGAGTVTAGGPDGSAGITTGSGNSPVTGNTTVNAGGGTTPTGTGAITASLSAAPQAALPGSVIAGGVRAGQLAAITTSLTNFAAAVTALPAPAATVNTNARQVAPAMVKAAGYTTVTVSGAVRAPNNQLFRLNTQPGARYLVETDPAFTNYRNWVSSDYFLTQLNLDPERTLKRYGDGFAEQRLIDDQILALTGRRFLGDYTSTEDEYQALLDAGVLFAQTYHLTPGVALTAEQMAALTTDIVWLETKTVTLPDGSTTLALVPTVYLRRPVAGDLSPTGALIAGSNVTLRSPGSNITNTGTIIANGGAVAGNGKLTLEGQNVSNSGTLGGNVISVSATQTLDNTGGVIQGLGNASSISLNARDILLRTTVQTSTASIEGPNGESTGTRTNVDRVATVSAGSVTLAALGNINLQGASVNASGNLNISAGGSITSDAVQTGYTLNIPLGGAGGTTQGRTGHYEVASTTQRLSSLSGNTVTLVATGDAAFKGTNVNATTNLSFTAQNIRIEAVKDSLSIDQQGVNKKGYERVAKADETLVGGSFTAGSNLSLTATGGDIKATGALVSADEGAATLTASGNIALQNATTEHSTDNEYFSASKGFLSSQSLQRDSASQATLAEGSTVSGKTVAVVAGTDINIRGSGVVSDTQTTLSAGRDVNLSAATETLTSSSFFEEKKSGFGALGGLSFGKRELSNEADNTATHAAASTVGSLSGNVSITAGNTYTQVGSDVMTPQGNIDITAKTVSITEARETASSETEQKFKQTGIAVTVSNPILSAVQTVGSMTEQAGKSKDARMQALAVAASVDAVDKAMGALNQDPTHVGGIGINISLGTQKSQSNSQGHSDTSAGSTVAAGGNVTIAAQGRGDASDLTVRGSQISAGGTANLLADGEVNLLAAQNTSEQHTQNTGSSASIGVGINFGAQTNGVSFSASASSSRGNSDGSDVTHVNTQVTAGNAVHIQSGGDTTLQGAVVAAHTVTAVIGGNLSIESLQDTAKFDEKQSSSGFGVTICPPPICAGASSVSVSGGKSNINSNYQSVGEQSGIRAGDGGFTVSVAGNTDLKGGAITSTDAAVQAGANAFATGGTLTTTDIQNSANYDANAASLTVGYSGAPHDMAGNPVKDAHGNIINGKAINSGGLGRDNGDAASVTQAAISGVAGNTNARTGDQETGLKPIFDATAVRDSINAGVAITQAGLPVVTTAWANFASEQERKATTPQEKACWAEGGACRVAGHAAIGALAGGAAGAAGAAVSQAVIPTIGDALADADLPLGLKQSVIAGLGTVIGAAAGGTAGAVTGGNATVNNYLTRAQWEAFANERDKCVDEACRKTLDAKYTQTSAQQDQALRAACTDLNSANCRTLVAAAADGSAAQQALVTSNRLPDNYLVGRNFNSNVNLFVQKVQAQDVVNACNLNPAQCDAARLAGSAQVLLTGVSLASVIALAPELAAIASMGVPQYCMLRTQSCLNLLNAAAEVTAGVPVSGVTVPSGAGRGSTSGARTEPNARIANNSARDGSHLAISDLPPPQAAVLSNLNNPGMLAPGWTPNRVYEEVISVSRGQRPLPETYLSAEQVSSHLQQFESGVVKIKAAPPAGTEGPPGGTFVLSKAEADRLISAANGSVSRLEDALSLPRGTLGNAPVLVEIKNPSGLRMPSGNELGANSQWIPGGRTGGGIAEATIDPVPVGGYTVRSIFGN